MGHINQIKNRMKCVAKRIFHPYHHSEESILDHIASSTENGELPSAFSLAKYLHPDESIVFADGMLDGIDLYSMGFEPISDEARSHIEEAIIAASIGHYDRADRIFLDLANEYGALGLVDEIQRCVLREASSIDQSALRDYAIECIRHSDEVGLPKIGLMLLELYGEQDDYTKTAIRTIALSDEYTLYAMWNMRNWNNGNDELFDLVKKVHGWGRIHIIKEIEPASESMRRWILFNGVDNIAPCECAVECFIKSDANLLLMNGMDREEFVAVGKIIEGMIEGPKKDLSSIKEWRNILKLYLDSAEEHELDIDDLNRLFYFLKYGSKCGFENFESTCLSILHSEHNRETINSALEKGDSIELARFMNISYESILIDLLDRDFQNQYSRITFLSDSPLFPCAVDIFRREIPISSIAYDPMDETGLGDEWKMYRQLGFLLQELRNKMPLALDCVLKGLGSPVNSNRSMSTSVLQSWVSDEQKPLSTLSPEAYALLECVHRIEPVESIKIDMGKLLQGVHDLDGSRADEGMEQNLMDDPPQECTAMLKLLELENSALKSMRYDSDSGFHLEIACSEFGFTKIEIPMFAFLLIKNIRSNGSSSGIYVNADRDLINLLHERSYTAFPIAMCDHFRIIVSDWMIDIVSTNEPSISCTRPSCLIDEYRNDASIYCVNKKSPIRGGTLSFNIDNIECIDLISSALFFDGSESYVPIRNACDIFSRPIKLEKLEIENGRFELTFLSGRKEERNKVFSAHSPKAILILDELANHRVFSKAHENDPLLGTVYEIQGSRFSRSSGSSWDDVRHIRIEEADLAVDIYSADPPVFEKTFEWDVQAQYPFDFKDRFSIAYFCPRNTSGFKYDLSWLEDKIDIDWAFLFLAVGGGYLEYDVIFRFAMEKLESQSDGPIYELALMFFESAPDYLVADEHIEQLVNNVDLKSWAVAFLKLFFVSLDWFCLNSDVQDDDFQLRLDMVCYDFFELVIYDDVVDFPFLCICDNRCLDIVARRKLRQEYEDAARRYLESLHRIGCSEDDLEKLIRCVISAWDNYGCKRKMPYILGDEEVAAAAFAQYDPPLLKTEQKQVEKVVNNCDMAKSHESHITKKIWAYVAFFVLLGLIKIINHLIG